MKLFKYILVGWCLLTGMYSCEYVIDLEPENQVSFTNFFKTEQDISAVVNMFHINLRAAETRVIERDMLGWFADKVNEPTAYTRYTQIINLDPAYYVNYTGTTFTWSTYYSGAIYNSNLLLDNAFRAEFDKDRLKFYLLQAYFVKGISYFRAVQNYGDAPIINSSLETGAQARKPVKEVLAEAEKWALMAMELPKFEDLVDMNGASITSKQYASRGAAAALLANIYAWRAALDGSKQDWEQAEAYCSKIIEGEVGYYDLVNTPDEVCSKVLLRNSIEGVWELQMDQVDNQYYTTATNHLYISLNVGFPARKGKNWTDKQVLELTKSKVLSLYDPEDRRVNAYFFGMDSVNYENKVFINKWNQHVVHETLAGSPTPTYKGVSANKVIWRLADIILLRAECRARLDNPKAVDDLNRIRERAYGNSDHNYKASEGDLRYAIFQERKKELMYEGQYYYDVVRNGYWKTELTEGFSQLTDEDVNNGALYLPITSNAFKENDLMVQNVYWLGKQQ